MRLRPTTRGFRLALLLWLLTGAAVARAQEQTPSQNDPAAQIETLSAQAGDAGSEPDVFFLPDESGRLRRVVGSTYEELMRAWSGRPPAAAGTSPGAVIEQLRGTVEVREDHAKVNLEAVVRKTGRGRVRTPLLMPDLILEESSLSPDSGALAIQPGSKGYSLWLWGPLGERHTLQIRGRIPLRQRDGSSHLKLSAPSAANQSLELRFEKPIILLRSSPGVRAAQDKTDSGTTLVAVGGVSPLEVEWSQEGAGDLAETTVLTADSLVQVQVQSDRVLCTADIRTQSPASAQNVIRVRLPDGFHSSEGSTNQKQVDGGLIELTPLKGKGPDRRYRLVCEAPLRDGSDSGPLKLGGFEILGAYTQRGRLEVASTDRLRVFCEMQGNLRQVSSGDPPADPEVRKVGSYEFGGADWVLSLHADTVRRVVRVRPEFDLRIAAGHAELTAEFDYLMTGPGDSLLRVALNQWKVVDAPEASGDALDVSRCYVSSNGDYVMHLRSPTTTSTRIRLNLRRDSQGGQRQFSLPEPIGGSVLPGSMTVDADPELVLNPDPKAMVGLSSLASSDRTTQNDGAFYYRTFFREVAFATRVGQRPVQLDVDLLTIVDIEDNQAVVRQQYACAVQYGQVSELVLLAPRDRVQQGIEVELREGEQWRTLSLVEALNETEDTAANSVAPVTVRLEEPLEGLSDFGVRYRVPIGPDAVRRRSALSVPLCAVEANSLASRVAVGTPSGYATDLASGRQASMWTRESVAAADSGRALFSAIGLPQEIALKVTPVGQEPQVRTAVLKAWTQSWVVAGVQQDRQRFRLRGEGELLMRLPPAAADLQIETRLDGQLVEATPSDDALRVTLPSNPHSGDHPGGSVLESHTLEVRWLRPLRRGLPEFLPVQIEGAPAGFPVVWDLILPSGQVLGAIPKGFTASGSSAAGPMLQAGDAGSEIAQWMAWPEEEDEPWSGTRYIFVSLSAPPEAKAYAFTRAWLVLLISLGFFAALSLVAYLESQARVSLATISLVGLVVCAVVWPHLASSLALGVFGGAGAAGAAALLRKHTALGDDASIGSSPTGIADSATHSWTGAHPSGAAPAPSGVGSSARSSA